MSLFVPWLVFPLALGALSLGCGALVARLAGLRAGPELLLPLGYATIVVAAGFVTWVPGTARLALPVVVGLAAAGLAASWRLERVSRSDVAALVAAGCVFLAYGLPVLASGEASFTGYISLDDTATWLALTDRTLEEGRSVDGLAPSSYEATLATNLGGGYPVGAFLPLGIGAELVGEDVAWVFQPYIAFVAALLALALYALARPLVRRLVGSRLRRRRRGPAGAALRLRAVERGEGGCRGVPHRRRAARSLREAPLPESAGRSR